MSAVSAPTSYVQVGPDLIGWRSIGRGPPILLLTRMRGTLDTWDPLFLDELARANRVITVDYPGVGYSSGSLPEDIGRAADFVAAFATAIGLEDFTLLGWSWGGLVAQAVATDHPGRANRLVLVGTNPPGIGPVAIQQVFLERAFKPVNDLADEEVLLFEPQSAASRRAAKASRERIRRRPDVDARIPSTQPQIQAYLSAAASFRDDSRGRVGTLARLRIPMLALCGDHDTSTAAENWFALIRRFPRLYLIVYPEAGHGPHHQYPELAVSHINLFLTSTKDNA